MLDIAAIQAALKADGIDGWLLYDFRGLNAIAADFTAVTRQGGHLATRRWYYLIPATGEPRGLVHAIETQLARASARHDERYAGRDQLEAGLRDCSTGVRRVAMEYSPDCAIPYVSRVDAGTIELVRQSGVEVVSSGDLVQRFAAVWDATAIATHRDGVREALPRQGSGVRRASRGACATASPTTEYDIQQLMAGWFRDEGLVSDSTRTSRRPENAGNPHYLPTRRRIAPIGRDELVLLDLWGKLDRPGAVFADITWIGYTGPRVPERYAQAFAAVAAARDAAIALVQRAARGGRELRGWRGRSRRVAVLRERRLRRPDPAPHRPQPRRDRCTATA